MSVVLPDGAFPIELGEPVPAAKLNMASGALHSQALATAIELSERFVGGGIYLRIAPVQQVNAKDAVKYLMMPLAISLDARIANDRAEIRDALNGHLLVEIVNLAIPPGLNT